MLENLRGKYKLEDAGDDARMHFEIDHCFSSESLPTISDCVISQWF
jgi:hypothetical protein